MFPFLTCMTRSLELHFADTHGRCSDLRGDICADLLFRPPHQIMMWVGLERYGYLEEAQRLAYRFLYM